MRYYLYELSYLILQIFPQAFKFFGKHQGRRLGPSRAATISRAVITRILFLVKITTITMSR